MLPYDQLTANYLKQVLGGDKLLKKASDIKLCNPPHFDEVSVTSLYGKCIKLEGMSKYFPDHYAKGRRCNRAYFFGILNTLYPDYVSELITNSKSIRYAAESEAQKVNTIAMTPEWERELREYPNYASKCFILKSISF